MVVVHVMHCIEFPRHALHKPLRRNLAIRILLLLGVLARAAYGTLGGCHGNPHRVLIAGQTTLD